MPKRRKFELVRCSHFSWRLVLRRETWYADGRSNVPNPGRHSLGTSDKREALRLIAELDQVRAEELGLIATSHRLHEHAKPLELAAGRKLYEAYIGRPRVTGGVRASTAKRYRTVFDKFIRFAVSRGVTIWNVVTAELLTAYAAHLQGLNYAYKSQTNELTVLKQAVKWMIQQGHLQGKNPIELKLRRAESEPAYCYRGEEIAAIVGFCRQNSEDLGWLGDVVIGLACTGLRISELAGLRWSDINLQSARLHLTDETGRPARSDGQRREVKSGRSRTFPIHPDFLAVLNRLDHRDSLVFHGPRGGRLKPDTVRRILVRRVIKPLTEQFPTDVGERGFNAGRLHSFRHAFCSTCANSGVPERMVMDWLGHNDSTMIKHYYHLHDDESRRRMNELDFLGGAGGRSPGHKLGFSNEESVEPNELES